MVRKFRAALLFGISISWLMSSAALPPALADDNATAQLQGPAAPPLGTNSSENDSIPRAQQFAPGETAPLPPLEEPESLREEFERRPPGTEIPGFMEPSEGLPQEPPGTEVPEFMAPQQDPEQRPPGVQEPDFFAPQEPLRPDPEQPLLPAPSLGAPPGPVSPTQPTPEQTAPSLGTPPTPGAPSLGTPPAQGSTP